MTILMFGNRFSSIVLVRNNSLRRGVSDVGIGDFSPCAERIGSAQALSNFEPSEKGAQIRKICSFLILIADIFYRLLIGESNLTSRLAQVLCLNKRYLAGSPSGARPTVEPVGAVLFYQLIVNAQ
jgi:hypothetical protein